MAATLAGQRILLIIGGGIAAYKSLDLIRRLKERGASVRVVMTKAAQEFVTPLSAGALAGERVFTDLFDAVTEFDVGHIRLARDTDLIVVAPATADLMARMANGLADDLATAVLLATDKPVLIAPAMNPHMWEHEATQRNLARLRADGIAVVGPNAGEMAERGEAGLGRMAEPIEIVDAADALLAQHSRRPLAGKRILITSGPTHEPIDPVRYIANRSSGKQGYAIARAAAEAGAKVTLISRPGDASRSARRQGRACRDSARDMLGGRRSRAAGRCRDLRRRRRRLARRRRGPAEDQERRAGDTPHADARRKPRHPGDDRASQVQAPEAGHRLCGRNRKRDRACAGQAQAQGLRLDPGQRRVGGIRRDGRRPQHDPPRHAPRASSDWPEQSKDEVAQMLVERIPAS